VSTRGHLRAAATALANRIFNSFWHPAENLHAGSLLAGGRRVRRVSHPRGSWQRLEALGGLTERRRAILGT
jgi:hypothetical protein